MSARDVTDLVLLGGIWGASFLFMRVAVPEFGPIPLIAARVGIAAVFLMAVVAKRGGSRAIYANAAPLSILGALNSAIPFTLFAYAVMSVTSGFAAVLNSTAPLFGAFVAFVWLRDRPSPMRIAGLTVGFAGVVVLVSGRLSVNGASGGLAVMAGLTAALLYGIAANYAKRRLKGIDSLVIATGSLIAATALLAIPAAIYWPPVTPSAAGWVSAMLLSIFCTGVAYILYFRLLERVGPAKALAVTYLIPAFGVVWGYVFLHEAITSSMIAGCSVILLGTALTTGAFESRV